MRMLYDHILVKEVKKESSVLDVKDKQRYPEVGEVVDVGPGDAYGYPSSYPSNDMKAMTCRPGDVIYFSKDRAARVELKKGVFYIIKERDVYGILEKDEK